MKYQYLVWDKYLEQCALMVKDFDNHTVTVDTIKDTSSFYSIKSEYDLIERTYDMLLARDMDTLENRYTVVKQYNN